MQYPTGSSIDGLKNDWCDRPPGHETPLLAAAICSSVAHQRNPAAYILFCFSLWSGGDAVGAICVPIAQTLRAERVVIAAAERVDRSEAGTRSVRDTVEGEGNCVRAPPRAASYDLMVQML